MRTDPELIVCEHCDAVYRRLTLARGQVARCDVCGAVLYRAERLDLEQWLALTIAAAIVFVLANAYPIIRIGMGGLHNEATLWQSVAALAHGPAAPIAVPAAITAIGVPFMQIVLLGWVLGFARLGRRAPGFAGAMRLLHGLRPWSMVEVCLLGALVSVVKLSGYLEVLPGVGIWAMAALSVLLPLIANRDSAPLWHRVGGNPTCR